MATELEKKLHGLGESLDRLISIDIHRRGVIHELYQKARELSGQPLTSTAALALHQKVEPGRPVFFITGFPSLTWMFKGVCETDGPAGSAVLARILQETKQAVPVIITAESHIPSMQAALHAAGLVATDIHTAIRSKQEDLSVPVAAVLAFPTDYKEAEDAADWLFRYYEPTAVIAVEMPGPGKDCHCYTFQGHPLPQEMIVKGCVLFKHAQQRNILTIGFGDGGNELGMGKLAETTVRTVSNGSKIACLVPADLTVAAAISNWGTYGVAAALAVAEEQPQLMQQLNLQRIVKRIIDFGGVDGKTNRPVIQEDGVPIVYTENLMLVANYLLTRPEDAWS